MQPDVISEKAKKTGINLDRAWLASFCWVHVNVGSVQNATRHTDFQKKSSYLKWQSERSPFATEETAAPHLLSSLCRPARSAVCTDMNFAMCAPQRGQRLCAAAAAAAAAADDKWTGNWWRGGAGGGGGGGEVVGGLGGISILVRVDSLKSLEEPFKRFLRGL